jgi:hypothetical protein
MHSWLADPTTLRRDVQNHARDIDAGAFVTGERLLARCVAVGLAAVGGAHEEA